MSERVLRVGIAGQGRSGYDNHAHWLKQVPRQYKIVAVADQLPERRDEAAKVMGCRVYDDYRSLIADKDLDLFVNALPSHLHPKATIQALQAGHNVVSEKPFALKVADADRMIQAARKSRRLLAPFQNSRFYDYFIKIQEVIASGKLGKIVYVRSNWSSFGRRWDWQTRQDFWGGNLNNTGPHPMDHAIMLFGKAMPKVFCRMGCFNEMGGDADDFAMVVLHGRNAPTIEVVVNSYQAYGQGDQYNVCGTLGGLSGGASGLKWKYFDPAKAPKQTLMPLWSQDRKFCRETLPWIEEAWTPTPGEPAGVAKLSRGFYNNIYDVLVHGAKPVISIAEVRRQVAVLEECHRQAPLPRRKRK